MSLWLRKGGLVIRLVRHWMVCFLNVFSASFILLFMTSYDKLHEFWHF